ncbi:MAG: LicD family protein [Bacilli bacterium]|nr:LicD family protein [Bacilli bacterium]
MDNYYVNDISCEIIQKRIFDIALEIKRICDLHNIQYVLDAGTLLGAVRHGGFIPWDDDFDIAMTRDNYEKFRNACFKDLGKDFFLQDNTTDKKYPFDFLKIKLNNTKYTEPCMVGLNVRDGVYVDVFPIDNVTKHSSNIQAKMISFIRNVRWTKTHYKCQPLYKKIITFGFSLFPLSWINGYANHILMLKNKKQTNLVRKLCHPGKRKPAEPLSLYIDTQDISFNGVNFKCPKDYKILLENRYGDFMKLPPVEKRQPTHGIIEIKL